MSPQSGLNCGLPALHTVLCLSAYSLFFLPVVTLTKTKMGFYEVAPVFMAVFTIERQGG